MTDPEQAKKSKTYEAPKIEYEEVVEAIAGVCSSSFDGIYTCRYTPGPCDGSAITS